MEKFPIEQKNIYPDRKIEMDLKKFVGMIKESSIISRYDIDIEHAIKRIGYDIDEAKEFLKEYEAKGIDEEEIKKLKELIAELDKELLVYKAKRN